ncbi:Shikimate kinase 1, chloroplastic [Glycine max]|nr:Shikimate kinase 1, chloroplastic [Glycine max]
MEAQAVQVLRYSATLHSNNPKLEKTGTNGSLRMFGGFKKQLFVSSKLQSAKPSANIRRRTASLVVACSHNNIPASALEYGSFHSSVEEKLILKIKSQEIEPYLSGRCIYLVGMMASGKTTVGRILSEALSYSFYDSDALVVKEVGGISVTDIFKHYGEPFFRNKETEVLQKVSIMHRHLISTGGGAVVRPINWKYMQQGISVWLDVPVEVLTQRITAEGTDSRPLLHYEGGDAYTKTITHLSSLFEERSEAYANANVKVSLENMAAKLGRRDVLDLSPTAIAMEFQDEAPRNLKWFKACKFSAMVHSKKLGRTEPNGSAGWIQGAASTLQSGSFHAPVDEMLILKSKSQEIEPYLNGRCIYLVDQSLGMMGSGKTTVGKILSQVLSYLFFDSDALVEEEVDGTAVADIFKHNGEPFFRNKETEVLRKLSMMHRYVISTGGGAVVRPINWKYMQQGISVWLDVPVEALAQRITAVGTDSRPLLHYEEGDAYTKTFMRLSALFKERSEAYANANVKVSLENMAAKLGSRDESDLSPTAIAMEALEQIKGFLMGEDGC